MEGTSSQSLLIRAETLAMYSVSYMHILLQVELVQVMPGSTKSKCYTYKFTICSALFVWQSANIS